MTECRAGRGQALELDLQMKLLRTLLLLMLAAFSGYGFLASFEPLEGAMRWRVGYGAVGLGCLYGVWRTLRQGEGGSSQ